MEVHLFTEYHGRTKQDYGTIAKGYEEESTIKDDTRQRRGYNNMHTVVNFTAETDLSGKKEELLSRDITKQRVIRMILLLYKYFLSYTNYLRPLSFLHIFLTHVL